MAGKLRHVQERNGIFYVRLAVPKELQSQLGRSELRADCGRDKRSLNARMHAALADFQRQLDDAREKLTAGSDRRSAARSFYGRELARHDRERETDQESAPSHARARELYGIKLRQLVSGNLDPDEAEAIMGWAADEAVAMGEATNVPRPELLRTLAGVELEALITFGQRERHEPVTEPKHPLLVEATSGPSGFSDGARSRIVSDDSLKPLSALLPRFHAERKIATGTADEHRVAVRMLEEFLGEPKPVCEITRRNMLDFKSALLQAPNRYSLRFPTMNLPQAIEANAKRKDPFPTLTATTINKKWLAHLKAIFEWCVPNDVLPDNPAAGVKVDEGSGMKEATRVPFSTDDLKRLFGKSFCEDGKLATNQWAMLIALFSGARSSSEIARLKLSDVRHERSILVFDFEEASKNKRSKRIVPVHRRLIDLGLVAYVEELKRKGESLLFPDWHPEDKVNRWFLRSYRPSVGIHDGRKVFHSFRHTFKTALASASVSRDVSDLITGHEDQSVGGIYIHDKHSNMIEAMAEGVNRVDFEAVDWKHLRLK